MRTSSSRLYFYPNAHAEHFASNFWAIFQALREDNDSQATFPVVVVDDGTLAVVAALLLVADQLENVSLSVAEK